MQDAANGVAGADGNNLAAVGAGVVHVHEAVGGLPFIEDGACEVREDGYSLVLSSLVYYSSCPSCFDVKVSYFIVPYADAVFF